MPIIKCSHCKKEYNLDKKLSWKRGKCINCWNEFLITFKEKNKNVSYYILQSIKWFFIFFLSGILLLSVSIFISKLNLYKQSDFNIPKDFFNTQFWDKDPYSSENGYNDFVDFIKLLDKKDIWYIDFLSICLFDNENNDNWKCTNNADFYDKKLESKIIQEYFQKTKNAANNKNEIEENIRKISYIVENIKKSEKIDIVNSQQFFSKYKKNNINKEYVEIYFLWKQYYKANKEKILEKEYKEFKNFVYVNKIKYQNIKNKEYLLVPPKYTWAYDATSEYDPNNNTFLGWEVLVYTSLLQYSRWLRYVAYNYFEDGKYGSWIDTLLEYQEFIDYLMNKTDSNLTQTLVYLTIAKINLETIEYFIDNYDLTDDQQNRIKNILEYKINEWLVENSIKFDHQIAKSVFPYIYDSAFHNENWFLERIRSIIEVSLFFSVEESELLSDKITYDIIKNNWAKSSFKCKKNIGNYAWRLIMCNYSTEYIKTYEKEKNLRILRENILKKLKKPE